MVGLPDGEKNFEDKYNRLDTMPACDGRNGRTDILPRHRPRYAYASRGNKSAKGLSAYQHQKPGTVYSTTLGWKPAQTALNEN